MLKYFYKGRLSSHAVLVFYYIGEHFIFLFDEAWMSHRPLVSYIFYNCSSNHEGVTMLVFPIRLCTYN